jgi:peptidyl-prolyl cis-trans isomerase C
MNSSLFRTCILALATVFATASALAADKADKTKKTEAASTVLASVNGKTIPQSRADAIAAAQIAQGRPDNEELRKSIRDGLIQTEIVLQEAIKKGFDKKPDVKMQMDLARNNVVINAYMADFVRSHPIDDETVKKEYEKIREQLGNKEFKARHILVDKEEDAKAIIEKLNKGEKFEDLAKASKDPGSKDKGGDLGWAVPAQNYVKPFADALVKLEKGKYTATPVKTDFGYHVIMLDDTRDLKLPGFDEVKPQLTQRLQQQMVEKHLAELRAKAKVE